MSDFTVTGQRGVDHVFHGMTGQASAAALITAALTSECVAPNEAAEAALTQLSHELTCLGDVIRGGTDLEPEILTTWVQGMARRAEVAAELSSRMRAGAKRV